MISVKGSCLSLNSAIHDPVFFLASNAEQDQTARTCSLILLCTHRFSISTFCQLYPNPIPLIQLEYADLSGISIRQDLSVKGCCCCFVVAVFCCYCSCSACCN